MSRKIRRRVVIVIEEGEDGEYTAYSPDLPALAATGETMPEVVTMVAFEVSQMFAEVAR